PPGQRGIGPRPLRRRCAPCGSRAPRARLGRLHRERLPRPRPRTPSGVPRLPRGAGRCGARPPAHRGDPGRRPRRRAAHPGPAAAYEARPPGPDRGGVPVMRPGVLAVVALAAVTAACGALFETDVELPTSYSTVSAGGEHTCALDSDGAA